MSDLQGLIEVKSGEASGNAFIYSIVKTLKEEIPGVQYTLMLDKQCDDEIVRVQGFFDEIGTTGMRDNLVFALFEPDEELEQRMTDWVCDPYDPSYAHGKPMNMSEQESFDEQFPGHPLSMCRELVRAICAYDDPAGMSTMDEQHEKAKEAEKALMLVEQDAKGCFSNETRELILGSDCPIESDLDGWDYVACVATAILSATLTTNEQLEKWLAEVHDASNGQSGDYSQLQKLLAKTMRHSSDHMDIFTTRNDNDDSPYSIFHRLFWGHDILSFKAEVQDNPFVLMWNQYRDEGKCGLEGILQAVRHLIADTFSKQGLPLPGSSYADCARENGRSWNHLIDIVQELSKEAYGDKTHAEKIYEHLLTIRVQDIAGGMLAGAMINAYMLGRGIKDDIRQVQIRLIAYTMAFYLQALVGAARQNGVPYINTPLGFAMIKEMAHLLIKSNACTNRLNNKTMKINARTSELTSEHERLKRRFNEEVLGIRENEES